MANKQPEVTERTKANLRQAFWELYTDMPLEKISIKAITDKAGYNRGTFYLYYKDVYDMLEQIEQELLEVLQQLVNERLIKDGRLNIENNMGLLLEMSRQYEGYFTVLLGEHGDPHFQKRFKDLIWPLVEAYLTPRYPLAEDEKPFVREFYLSGLVATVSLWLCEGKDVPIDRFVSSILRYLGAAA